MENQQPNVPVEEVNDGRKDIYLSALGKDGKSFTMAILTQETLEGYEVDYEEAKKDPTLIASTLFALGTFVAHQANPDKPMIDIAKMVQAYPEALVLIDYFIRRCEGKEVPEGHGQIISKRAYKKFKDFQLKWMPSMAEEAENGN